MSATYDTYEAICADDSNVPVGRVPFSAQLAAAAWRRELRQTTGPGRDPGPAVTATGQ